MFPSAEITDILRSVGLWDVLATGRAENAEAVLDAKLNDTMLSQGQKQLFIRVPSALSMRIIRIAPFALGPGTPMPASL